MGGSDLRIACRALLRMPGLASVVVVSLGIGIGVNTAVFSWVQAMVFHPLPGVGDASEIHLIDAVSESGLRPGSSWPEYRDLRERVPALRDIAAFRMVPFAVGSSGRAERATGLLVSGNYFSALRMQPVLGRWIREDEAAQPGGAAVAVISYGFWQTQFGGTADAVNQTVRVNDRELTVIGVAPEEFQGTVLGLQFDLWVPATMAPLLMGGSRELDDRGVRGYYVMARLSPATPHARAQAGADAAMRELAKAYPASNTGMTAQVLPFWRASRGPQLMLLSAIAVLQGIMLLLLLAVCANAANLLLARASARKREIGVRLAMGAGPWRVARLLLAENLVMAALAAVLGSAIAVWGSQALRAGQMLTMAFPVRFQTAVDGWTLAFAAGLAVLSAVVFGAAPAWQMARVDPLRALRTGSGGTPLKGALRQALMATEVGVAIVVLLVAALFFHSVRDARDLDPGFRADGVLLAAYDLTGRIEDAAGAREFATRLLDRLKAMPDARSAAIAGAVPLDIHGLPVRGFTLEGRARMDGTPDRTLSNVVTPGYFETMGIAVLEGKDFAELSDRSTPPQAIVNQAFVRQFIGDGQVLGRQVENNGRPYTIAGVVRDSVSNAFGEAPTPCLYFSYRDRPAWSGEMHVRTRSGAEANLTAEIRRIVRDLDASLPVFNVRTLTTHIDTNLFLRKVPARMFVVLGPLLLVLAAIGIYAVVSYSVAQRTTEIGVRLALGATSRGVVRQVVVENLMVIGLGALAGWLAVFLPYGHLGAGMPVSATVFGGVPLALLLVAAVASWLPARRLASVDPVVALRTD